LGDVDEKGMKETVKQVEKVGGKVVSAKCDVTSWESQLALFSLGMTKFGSIDIVLPNAGVSEIGRFDQRMEEDGIQDRPTKPNLKTLEIDLIAVMYTTRIALWYFANDQRDADKQGLRAIAFTGSMSSFYGATMGVQYGAAKAGILGIHKGIIETCNSLDVRVATIAPYFVKTPLLTADFVHPNSKMGYAKLEDTVAAFVAGITETDPATNFCAYLIPDDKGVFRMATSGYLVGAEGARRPRDNSNKKGNAGQGERGSKL